MNAREIEAQARLRMTVDQQGEQIEKCAHVANLLHEVQQGHTTAIEELRSERQEDFDLLHELRGRLAAQSAVIADLTVRLDRLEQNVPEITASLDRLTGDMGQADWWKQEEEEG